MCNLIPEELQDAIKVAITVGSLKETKEVFKDEIDILLDSGCAKGISSWEYDDELIYFNSMLKAIDMLLGWYE